MTGRLRVATSEPGPAHGGIARRVAGLDWDGISQSLDIFGYATTGPLLEPEECSSLAATYASDKGFRSRVIMSRHGFGRGEYKYLDYPLPELIAGLRTAFYAPLAEIANRWNEHLGIGQEFPRSHADYVARCRKAGQTKATPLLLQYEAGDYNCLHQDLYGELVFPIQITVFSDSNHRFAGRAAGRFHRRRVRLDRATAAHAIPRGGCHTRPRGSRDFPGSPSARSRNSGHLSREHASWSKSGALGPTLHVGDHLS